jgi:competence protein ComEA
MLFRGRVKQYFTFTTGERRGIIVLLVIMCLLLGTRIIIPSILLNKKSVIVSVAGNVQSGNTDINSDVQINTDVSEQMPHISVKQGFILDLNQAEFKVLQSCGFSKFMASNIVKYREKGGVFYKKEDLLKIYGIDTASLNKIEGKVIFVYGTKPFTESYTRNIKSIQYIDINMADTNSLMSISGIGTVLSKRIIKYRESLGGFYNKEQLMEVFGIDKELYLKIISSLIIDSSLVKKMKVNAADEKTMACHPYISNYQAKAIVQYRKKTGRILNLDELLKNNIFTGDEFSRVARYLTIN